MDDLEHHTVAGINGENGNREYTSSPGYDTCSSTAPASSPDYTYEAAIETYKNRVSRVGQPSRYRFNGGQFSKDSTPERVEPNNNFAARKPVVKSAKMEERLLSMTMKANENGTDEKAVKKDLLPKVDISKRRELFEKQTAEANLSVQSLTPKSPIADEVKVKSIKERLSHLETHRTEVKHEPEELPFEIPSIRERFVILEKRVTNDDKPKVDVPLSVSLKDRLSSLQASVTASNVPSKPTIVLEKEQEITKVADESSNAMIQNRHLLKPEEIEAVDTDREDSGIHTTDVSCSVSQADEQNDEQRIDDLNTVEAVTPSFNYRTDDDEITEDSLALLAQISAREVLRTVEEQIEKELSALAVVDEIRHVHFHSQPIPDLIPTESSVYAQHIQQQEEEPRSLTPAPVSLESESVAADVSVSQSSLSGSGSSALNNINKSISSTLLLDVKQLIDNLASNEMVEGTATASLISNDFEDTTTTFNTSSMFDETTATEDSSSFSLGASPYHLQYTELLQDDDNDPNVTTLPTPSLNMNLSNNVQRVEKEDVNDGDVLYEASRLPSTEIVLDYFSKSTPTSASLKNSRCSSPRSPTRSLLNFIKSNLLHATTACTSEQLAPPSPPPPQETSKFYVPLEEIDHIDEKSGKMRDSVINRVKECKFQKKGSTDSTVTMTSEINHLLDEELAKL